MPDVIDLISSTPPAPVEKPAPQSRAPLPPSPALVSSPPPFSANTTTNTRAPRPPRLPFTFSDDINIFSSPSINTHDIIDNNPSKRRRVSNEDINAPPSGQPRSRSGSPNRDLSTNTRKFNPFEFSDELGIPSSIGPTIRSKSPSLNLNAKKSNPFQFSDELGIPSSTGRKSRSGSPSLRAKSNPFQFSDELGIPPSIEPASGSRAESLNLNTGNSNPFKFSDDFDEFGLPPAPTPGSLVNPVITRGGGRVEDRSLGMGSRWAVDSDPIVFTSSARKPGGGVTESILQRRENTITIDSDDDTPNGNDTRKSKDRGKGRERGDEIEDFSDQLFSRMSDMDELMEIAERPKSTAPLSNRTASSLASLKDETSSASSGTKKTTARSRKEKTTAVEEQVDIDVDDLELPQPKRKTTIKPKTQDKEAKARGREASKAVREREREAEKERKAKAREEKAKQKQLAADLAQVNKSKIDKKESTPEMIVDFDKSLEGSSVGNQAVEFMNRLGVEYTFFESSIRGLVKWRRKVQATYNESQGYWEPCSLRIEPEKHVLCLLTAQEFVNMVTAPEDSPTTLQNHVLKLKQTHQLCKPIYLLEGLTVFMRKNQSARNRAYQAEVRRQLEPTTTSSSSSRRKNQPELPQVSDDSIEDALLQLQIHHDALIHHTSAAPESAEWLKTFTEHISTIPYRLELMQGNDSAFCMDVGQVKTGDDKRDTFVKMLQEVNRVTASMAYGVVERYPSVGDLVGGFKNGGVGLLEDVKKSANRNGALTDSRIGPAVSRRLYKVFMGLDPASTEI